MARCLPFRARQGTSILHWGYRGWGRFPLSKMTTLSRTCRCRKFTNIAVLIAARSIHTSTGNLHGPPAVGKAIWYVRGSSPRVEAAQLRLSSAARLCIYSCAPPSTQAPSPPRNPYTAPVPSATPVKKGPLPSYIAHTPPPTGTLPPGMDARPCRLSS